MNTAYLVLLILAILYVPLWIWVWRNPEKAGRFHLQKYGPAIMIKTHLGIKTMDKVAKYHRFWRLFGFISKLISAVLFFLMMYMLVVALLSLPARIGQPAIGIEYALAIPGFNPLLPLSYGLVALFVAMVVHELGHGIQTRTNGCKVDSTGLLHAVVPLGAFVEPNEEEMSKQPRRVQMDMYTAGISVNTFMAIACMLLMVFSCGFVSSGYSDEAGVYTVDSESPAFYGDIPVSAIITGIWDEDGNRIDYETSGMGMRVSMDPTDPSLEFDPRMAYTITYDYHGSSYTVQNFQIGIFIKTVVNDSPAAQSGIKPGNILYSVEFPDERGTQNIYSINTFFDVIGNAEPGETVTITTLSVREGVNDPLPTKHTVTFSDKNGVAFLGVSTNTSGMALTTPDILIDMAVDPFYTADGSPMSYVQSLFGYLSGPFNGQDPVNNAVKWWYDVPGDNLFWMSLTMLYWLFWLDLLLAISIALPAYPFDGGFIFAGGINWLLQKFGVKDDEKRQQLSDSVSNSVSTVTLFAFILVILTFLI